MTSSHGTKDNGSADHGSTNHDTMDHSTMDHSTMDMSPPAGDQSPSSQAFAKITAGMHKSMAVPLSGDADVDFVRSMVPHHQGAIDMARIELEFGKDPKIRKLAQAVIAAQQAEIEMMQAWLAEHGQ